MAPVLRIALRQTSPATLLAASELQSAWRRVTGGWVVPALGAADVTLGLGSLLRPSVVVDFAQPYQGEAARQADRIGLTVAAWDSLDGVEMWRELSAPLPRAHLGAPDVSRPWALSLDALPAGDCQLHLVGLSAARRGLREAVWWPTAASAPLLGRASMVLGPESPLVYDALRAGVPCRDVSPERLPPGALAGLVPPTLLGDVELWTHVADLARATREGEAPEPLLTPRWVGRGRELARHAQPSSLDRTRRKLLKLQRDPEAFFRDSRLPALRAMAQLPLAPRRLAKLRRDPQRFLADSQFATLRALGERWPRGEP